MKRGTRMRTLLATLISLAGLLPLASRAAIGCSPGTLMPTAHEFMVNQGLPYDVAGTSFVRGKDALVRVFLSLPQCALSTDSIVVTGGSLAVANGATVLGQGALFSPTAPAQVLAYYATTPPTPDNPSDPLFTVPGSILTPCGGAAGCADAAFTATFTATIRFRANGGAEQSLTLTHDAPFAKKSNALRLLVVPMGDPTQSFRSQFSTAAEAATRSGLATIARVMPVPGRVGELCPPPSVGSTDPGCGPAQPGGIRYHLDLASMVNLKDPSLGLNAYKGSPPAFCGSGSNFDAIKRDLAGFLESWNVLHPNNQVDVALGVVDNAITAPSSLGCVDGMGAVNSKEAWARIVPDQPGAPSRSGSTMSMEIAHSFGVVKNSATYHSTNLHATNASTASRAYNIDQRRFISADHSVMNYADTGGPWNNDTTLLEWLDQADSLCLLNGPPTVECATPTFSVGTTDNVNAGPTIVVSGTTDGTANGTDVNESFRTNNIPQSNVDPSSPYRLVETGVAGRTVLGFPVHFPQSSHSGLPDGSGSTDSCGTAPIPPACNQGSASMEGVFEVALADGVSADNFGLYYCPPAAPVTCASNPDPATNQAVLLYGRHHQATTPAVLGARSLQAGAGVNFTRGNLGELSASPTLNPQGTWITFQRSFVANSQFSAANVLSNGFMRTVNTSNGVTIDHCLLPPTGSFSPFALTQGGPGYLYTAMSFGSFAIGDGRIHRMTANCVDRGSVAVPPGVPQEIGAIAEDNGSDWIASYNADALGNAQLFQLDSTSGALLNACSIPSRARPGEGNDTLAIGYISGLAGSGKYLLTDAGGINTTTSQLFVIDVASCTGGAIVSPVATYTTPVGIGAAWYNAGQLWTSDGTILYKLLVPSGASGALTLASSATLADRPTTGLSVDPVRSEIHVAPAGDVNGGGTIIAPAPSGRPVFCGTDIAFSSTGDIWKTSVDLTTTPPKFGPLRVVFDASEITPSVGQFACLSDGRMVFETADQNTDRNLYIVNSDGTNLTRLNLPPGECGYDVSASPVAGDNRIIYSAYPCSGSSTALPGIATLDVNTGSHVLVVKAPGTSGSSDSSPAFGNNGRIAYVVRASNVEVHTVNLDGSDDRLVTADGPNAAGRQVGIAGNLVTFSRGQTNGNIDVEISNTAQKGTGYDVTGAAPDELRGDLIYTCANGVSEPVAVGVTPAAISGSVASFETTFDGSAACGGSGGNLTMYVSDGFDRVAASTSQQIPATADIKAPAPAIASPPDQQSYSTDGVIPLAGGGSDAQDGESSRAIWRFDSTAIGSTPQLDVSPPPGGWTPGSHTITLTMTNSSGLSSTATRTIMIVDDQPPVLSLAHSVNGANGWNVSSPATVNVAAKDDGTGLAMLGCTVDGAPVTPAPALVNGAHTYNGTVPVSGDGTHSIACTPTDGAGNAGVQALDTVKIDSIAPTVMVSSPSSGARLMLNEVINASYSCTDANLATCSGTVPSGSSINTSAAGSFTFAATGTDAAGNTTTVSVPYDVFDDHTPPALSVTHAVNGSSGWNHASPVQVTVTASDNQLGVNSISCTVDGNAATLSPALTPNALTYAGTLSVSGEGSHAVACSSADRAGNGSSATDAVKIDTIAPKVQVAVPQTNAVYYAGQVVAAAYSCSDAGSGIQSCVGSAANGAAIDTATEGQKNFVVRGTDVAGNLSAIVVPYTVNPACSAVSGLDVDYSTHSIFTIAGLKLTASAPTVEGTLHLRGPSCANINYRMHVLTADGSRELKSQTLRGDSTSNGISFSIDMGYGPLGQLLDPANVCVWAETEASTNGTQYDRVPVLNCISLQEDGSAMHVNH